MANKFPPVGKIYQAKFGELAYHLNFDADGKTMTEAAREKINHFLRKFILFFVSLFVTIFHFLKSDVTVAFYFTNYI